MRLLPAIFVVLLASPCVAQNRDPYTELEAPIVARLCAGMEQEVRVPAIGVADCVSATHAIEVEFDRYWKTAIARPLAYAAPLGRPPGIALVCARSAAHCLEASLGIRQTIGYN